jgi:hypothetical protein
MRPIKLFFRRRNVALRFGFQSQTKTFPFHTKEKAYKSGMLASLGHPGAFPSFSTSAFRAMTQSTRNRFLKILLQSTPKSTQLTSTDVLSSSQTAILQALQLRNLKMIQPPRKIPFFKEKIFSNDQ